MKYLTLPFMMIVVIFLSGCEKTELDHETTHIEIHAVIIPEPSPDISSPQSSAELIVAGAKKVVHNKTQYIEEYIVLDYPGGDVPEDTGVCTDLVIRALRNAGIDLQKEIYEDKKAHPEDYPLHIWEYKKPDKNIDHRRCQNMVVWFKKYAEERSESLAEGDLSDWEAGDVVFFQREGHEHPWHVGVVSPEKNSRGEPMMYHLVPPYARMDPVENFTPIHGRYRWKGEAPQIR